jgi:hypothetical protein
VANSNSGNISVLLNNGVGTFGSAINYTVISGPWRWPAAISTAMARQIWWLPAIPATRFRF